MSERKQACLAFLAANAVFASWAWMASGAAGRIENWFNSLVLGWQIFILPWFVLGVGLYAFLSLSAVFWFLAAPVVFFAHGGKDAEGCTDARSGRASVPRGPRPSLSP
jgi:hypothetical protein